MHSNDLQTCTHVEKVDNEHISMNILADRVIFNATVVIFDSVVVH